NPERWTAQKNKMAKIQSSQSKFHPLQTLTSLRSTPDHTRINVNAITNTNSRRTKVISFIETLRAIRIPNLNYTQKIALWATLTAAVIATVEIEQKLFCYLYNL
ncbi:hypothetical protein MBR63_005469, partial [Klebsiella pneumoniae]